MIINILYLVEQPTNHPTIHTKKCSSRKKKLTIFATLYYIANIFLAVKDLKNILNKVLSIVVKNIIVLVLRKQNQNVGGKLTKVGVGVY